MWWIDCFLQRYQAISRPGTGPGQRQFVCARCLDLAPKHPKTKTVFICRLLMGLKMPLKRLYAVRCSIEQCVYAVLRITYDRCVLDSSQLEKALLCFTWSIGFLPACSWARPMLYSMCRVLVAPPGCVVWRHILSAACVLYIQLCQKNLVSSRDGSQRTCV